MHKIYLDFAAATPVDSLVEAAMKPFMADKFHNPSAIYLDGREARKALEKARADIAHWLGCRPEEIIFTAGATEADNLAIQGVAAQYPDGNIVVSAIEHEAVIEAAKPYKTNLIPVDNRGRVNLESLKSAIDENTVLVSIMYASNEIGTVQPISDLAALIKTVRDERVATGNKLPLYFHSDATQAANYLDLHVNRLGVDLMTLNSGKIYGPKQVGCLYIRGGLKLEPIIRGGGQERSLRSGTESVAGAVGMAEALKLVQTDRKNESMRLQVLIDEAEKKLKSEIKDIEILGGKRRLPNNLCFILPGLDGERAVMELDERGIQCSTGSACTALSDESSHVVKALGYSEAEAAASLRLSLGRSTTRQDFETAINTIIESYRANRHTTSV